MIRLPFSPTRSLLLVTAVVGIMTAGTRNNPAPRVIARVFYGALVYQGKMWLLGGFDGRDYHNDVWRMMCGARRTACTGFESQTRPHGVRATSTWPLCSKAERGSSAVA